MIQKTVNDILSEEGITLTELASRVGVSIRLLSKAKNNNGTITKSTQTKFQAVYPDYELVNDKPKWKTLYEEEKARNEALAEDYARVTQDNEELRKRIDVVSEYLKTGDISRIFYNTREKY